MGRKILPLELLTDFECANAVLKERLGSARFHLTTRPDGALNNPHFAEADYYCAFRLRNPNPVAVQAQIAIEVLSLPKEGRSLAVRRRPDTTDPGVEAWQPFPRESTEVDPSTHTTRFRVPVLPRESLDVSTMSWLSASEVYATLATLRKRHPKVAIRSIGKMPGGRWIPAVEMFDDASREKPLIIIGATNQSHELGTVATLFLVREVLEGSLRELPELSRLVFLPLTNPDGNALGTCMTNAAGKTCSSVMGKTMTPRPMNARPSGITSRHSSRRFTSNCTATRTSIAPPFDPTCGTWIFTPRNGAVRSPNASTRSSTRSVHLRPFPLWRERSRKRVFARLW